MKSSIMTAITALGMLAIAGIAQDQPPVPGGDQQRRRGGPDAQQAQQNPDRMRQFGRISEAMQPSPIFANAKHVYILRGETLYQFSADTLEVSKKVQIPSATVGGQDAGGQDRRQIFAAMQPASLFATDKFVYVLKGEQLLQFRSDDLEPVKKASVPSPLGEPGGQAGQPRPDEPRRERKE